MLSPRLLPGEGKAARKGGPFPPLDEPKLWDTHSSISSSKLNPRRHKEEKKDTLNALFKQQKNPIYQQQKETPSRLTWIFQVDRSAGGRERGQAAAHSGGRAAMQTRGPCKVCGRQRDTEFLIAFLFKQAIAFWTNSSHYKRQCQASLTEACLH